MGDFHVNDKRLYLWRTCEGEIWIRGLVKRLLQFWRIEMKNNLVQFYDCIQGIYVGRETMGTIRFDWWLVRLLV